MLKTNSQRTDDIHIFHMIFIFSYLQKRDKYQIRLSPAFVPLLLPPNPTALMNMDKELFLGFLERTPQQMIDITVSHSWGSVVKNPSCSSRGPEFSSQHLHQAARNHL